MKKSFRILRIVLAVVVVLIIAAVVLVHLFADRAVKMGIQTGGSKALNVGVSVDDVDLSILAGKIGFKNLVIDNPPGYEHEKLLVLNDARIQVDIGSLLGDTVNIKEIRMDGVDLVLEQKGISSNNLQDIMKAMPAKEQQSEPSGKKLHIDNLELRNVTARVKLLPVPGKSDTLTLTLSPIQMTDLGGDNKLDVARLASTILVAIAGGIAEKGTGLLPDDMLDSVKNQLSKFKDLSAAYLEEGAKVLKEGTDLDTGVIEGGKDIGKGITDGLKGLIPSKKEEQDQ
jgi:hypothetical protein